MTDNEIIKSLEICANNGDCKKCHINPHKGNYGYCTSLAINKALDLINRQKAEIERMEAVYAHARTICYDQAIERVDFLVKELKGSAYAALLLEIRNILTSMWIEGVEVFGTDVDEKSETSDNITSIV